MTATGQKTETTRDSRDITRKRWQLVVSLNRILQPVMIFLAFAWMALLAMQLIYGSSPLLKTATGVIWFIFFLQFFLEFLLAPKKIAFLKKNIIPAVAMLLPILRIFQIFSFLQILTVSSGSQTIVILSALNRGMAALRRLMRRRGSIYITSLTIIVILLGASGMYAFEKRVADPQGIHSYVDAVYWTFMLITTIGSQYWPKTDEGKLLSCFLSAYAMGILSYMSATLASFFVGRDADEEEGEVAGEKSIRELRREIKELKEMVSNLVPPDK
jgi:voltage-gated potassium channel